MSARVGTDSGSPWLGSTAEENRWLVNWVEHLVGAGIVNYLLHLWYQNDAFQQAVSLVNSTLWSLFLFRLLWILLCRYVLPSRILDQVHAAACTTRQLHAFRGAREMGSDISEWVSGLCSQARHCIRQRLSRGFSDANYVHTSVDETSARITWTNHSLGECENNECSPMWQRQNSSNDDTTSSNAVELTSPPRPHSMERLEADDPSSRETTANEQTTRAIGFVGPESAPRDKDA